MTERNVQPRTYRLVYKVWPMVGGRRATPDHDEFGMVTVVAERVVESTVLDAYEDLEAVRRLEYRLIQEGCVHVKQRRGHGYETHELITPDYELIDVAPV